jgi:hypothetical protein
MRNDIELNNFDIAFQAAVKNAKALYSRHLTTKEIRHLIGTKWPILVANKAVAEVIHIAKQDLKIEQGRFDESVYKRVYESHHSKDIEGLVVAIRNAKGIDIGIHGFEEVGPDSPLVHKGPVNIWINADREIVVHNKSVSFHIRLSDIVIAETEEVDTYWSILLSNGQEFALDLRS